MWFLMIRAVVLALLVFAGTSLPIPDQPLSGVVAGIAAAGLVIALELKLRAVSGERLLGGLVGGAVGLLAARLLWGAWAGLDVGGGAFAQLFLVVLLCYVGRTIGAQKAAWFAPARIIAA